MRIQEFLTSSLLGQRTAEKTRVRGKKKNLNPHFRAKLRSRKLAVESLEARKLMAADLDVTVFDDLDRNGAFTAGENGIPGWKVFLDTNKDGVLNAGEVSIDTNKDGVAQFKSLAAGSYRVTEIVQLGWVATSPISQDVVVGTSNVKADFFNFSGGDIVGTVWNDLNDDGVRSSDPSTGMFTDPGLAGWTVFLDINNNTIPDVGEPTTTTAENGSYSFRDLKAGDYEVTEILPAGWDVAKKNDVRQTATVAARKQVVADVGNISLVNGSIKGVVFNDLNGDGSRAVDPATGVFTEPGLEGWTVFVDLNRNNVRDASDPFASTDANGTYRFLSLAAGDYEVFEVLPGGWNVSPLNDVKQTVTVRGGENTTAKDYANFTILNGSISGTMWNDINRNSIRDFDTAKGVYTDPPLAGWTVYLDLNRNKLADPAEPTAITDLAGNYKFFDLQVGDYEVHEIVKSGWEVATTFSDNNTVTVYSGVNSPAPDFANFDNAVFIPGSLAGTVWNDQNSNGLKDVGESGLAGWTVFLDQNSDGILNAGEQSIVTGVVGSYLFSSVVPGTVSIGVLPTTGWKGTTPVTNSRTVALKNAQDLIGLDFGEVQLRDSTISGTVYVDSNKNHAFDMTEHGLGGITVFIDVNNNSVMDAGEPSTTTSEDLFYTPTVNEAGQYSFTHLAAGTYNVREIVSSLLSATPANELLQTITIVGAENRTGVNSGVVYRPNEIHGSLYEDLNANHQRDAGENPIAGTTVFVDLNRNNTADAGEPTATTATDGTYQFLNLTPGAYVVREIVNSGFLQTAPTTLGGTLWPTGVSNPAVGNVTPLSITASLAQGQSHRETVTLTLPNTGALTNAVDVFLLFDDTGSFVNNSPIVRAAFPDIISRLQASLPGIDLGFGAGRFEEYANFAYEYSTGRPFVLNQPIVAASTPGYLASIQAALNRTTPGYGGDQPETDIEALFQLVTGKGFDGNNNGTTSESGPAGLASTQLNPGASGDVPAFSSFVPDPANSVLPAAGNVGGAGFRSGALPIVLLATDTGFAYQPKGETTISGVGGVTIPVSAMTQTSRSTTPNNLGAGIQETITGLNALGALVIGLGTNSVGNVDPRQQLESISKLTGATNQSTTDIPNGTPLPIKPGDPLYFQIASGFGASVANGVVSAIQNAVTNVAVDIDVRASDPRVHIINHTGVAKSVSSGKTSTFDIEFVGDGVPRRFDLQFVRSGTNVVLGSIPVVLGTPVPGDGYEFDELDDGKIELNDDFGNRASSSVPANSAPSFAKGADQIVLEDAFAQTVANWATAISPGSASEASQIVNFVASTDNVALFSSPPAITPDGTLSFTPAANANGVAIVTVVIHDNGGTANGGIDTSAPQTFTILVTPVNDAPVANDDSYSTNEDTALVVTLPGVLSNDVDIDSTTITALLVSAPTHGTLSLNSDGSFTYVPVANFFGVDSYTYKANDGSLDSNIGSVTINVNAVNDAPVAVNDSYTTNEDTPLVVAASGVLGNDIDIDSSTLSSLIVLGPTHGSVTLNSNGSFSYVPSTNYNGPDSFTYKANDGLLESNVALVSIDVVAVNDAPVARDDSYTVSAGIATLIASPGVLLNDTDGDSSVLTAVLVTVPSHGSVTLSPNGSFIYTPIAGYVGPDSFSYKANDGLLDSNVAQVLLSLTNQPPVALDDTYSTNEDSTLVVPVSGVLSNDTDPDSPTLASVLVLGPTHGTVTLNSNGSFTYVPNSNFNGVDSFTYAANDGLLNSNIATVRLNIVAVNDAPVAVDDSYSATSGVAKTIAAPGILRNDSDIDSPILTAVIVAAPMHGTVTLNLDGSFTYVSATGYVGTDVFTYVANDGALNSNVARVSIDVTPAATGFQFLVVDQKAKRTFSYDATGNSVGQSSLNSENTHGRGITTTSDGSTSWVVDSDGIVFVYGVDGDLLGSWEAKGIDKPEGITVSAGNLWIVDNETDRVYLFAGASSKRNGDMNPTNSFALDRLNREPRDIVTDGSLFWVVNDTANVDSVFRYGSDGKLQGSWTIDASNKTPTGITVDNSNSRNIWIADAGTDRIYKYEAGADRIGGQKVASSSFVLNSQNKDPQGIAFKATAAPARATSSPLFEAAKPVSPIEQVWSSVGNQWKGTAPTSADLLRPNSTKDVALSELMSNNEGLRKSESSSNASEFSSWFNDLELAIVDIAKGRLSKKQI